MKLFLILALIGVVLVGQASAGTSGKTTMQGKFTVPSYLKMDPDLRADGAAAGQSLVGKDFKAYNPGHSYKSPGNGLGVGHIDMRGHGRKGVAILVDWPETTPGKSDVPGVNYERLPQTLFSDLLNGDTYNPYTLPLFSNLATYKGTPAPTDRTLKNYFNAASYNQFGITIDVVSWVTLPHGYDYYLGQNKGFYNDNGDTFVGELVKDAIDGAIAQGVDFSQYAVPAQPGDFADLYGSATSFTTKDGQTVSKVVPNLFIIHRGSGAEYNLDPSIIWSHKWDILSAGYYGQYYQTGTYPADSSLEYFVRNGVVLNTYNIVPEVGQDITGYYYGTPRPASPPYVGVFAHEFTHVLGAPDLYDYGYDSEGVGMFSLMAAGSWGRDIPDRMYSGNSPVFHDAWNRYFLGFAPVKDIFPSSATQSITVRPAELYPDIFRINIPGSDGREYFLLENRQQIGFDRGLSYTADKSVPHGLVVYQVDENVLARNFHRPNEAANWDWNKRGDNFQDAGTGENHYGVAVVQADGRYDMEQYLNDGDAGDPFPGRANATQLLPDPVAGQPNTVSWLQWLPGRSITGITLSNIVENADGTITLDVTYAK